MAKLAVNASMQGTTRTPQRGSSSNSGNSEAVKRAKVIAAGLFILLIALHSQGKE